MTKSKKMQKDPTPTVQAPTNLQMVDGHYPIIDVSGAEAIFPGDVTRLMPEYTCDFRSTWGRKMFAKWFFHGLREGELVPREGIDAAKALRHLQAIMGSFNHKHQHKEEAAARLLEDWFQAPIEQEKNHAAG